MNVATAMAAFSYQFTGTSGCCLLVDQWVEKKIGSYVFRSHPATHSCNNQTKSRLCNHSGGFYFIEYIYIYIFELLASSGCDSVGPHSHCVYTLHVTRHQIKETSHSSPQIMTAILPLSKQEIHITVLLVKPLQIWMLFAMGESLTHTDIVLNQPNLFHFPSQIVFSPLLSQRCDVLLMRQTC